MESGNEKGFEKWKRIGFENFNIDLERFEGIQTLPDESTWCSKRSTKGKATSYSKQTQIPAREDHDNFE